MKNLKYFIVSVLLISSAVYGASSSSANSNSLISEPVITILTMGTCFNNLPSIANASLDINSSLESKNRHLLINFSQLFAEAQKYSRGQALPSRDGALLLMRPVRAELQDPTGLISVAHYFLASLQLYNKEGIDKQREIFKCFEATYRNHVSKFKILKEDANLWIVSPKADRCGFEKDLPKDSVRFFDFDEISQTTVKVNLFPSSIPSLQINGISKLMLEPADLAKTTPAISSPSKRIKIDSESETDSQ